MTIAIFILNSSRTKTIVLIEKHSLCGLFECPFVETYYIVLLDHGVHSASVKCSFYCSKYCFCFTTIMKNGFLV